MTNRSPIHRRAFLQAMGGSAAALVAGGAARALPTVNEQVVDVDPLVCRSLVMPCLDKNYRVCEIFLRGGLACLETLWVTYASPDFAARPDYQDDLVWSDLTDRPVATNYYLNTTLPLGTPSLGACAEPLFAFDTDRPAMRVIAVQHDLRPHEAAVPYALTGTRLGRPTLAGMAAAFNKAFADSPGALQSVVFHSESDVWIPHASATGTHGSGYAPLVVRLGDESFIPNLGRTPKDLTNADGLLALYADRYEQSMSFQGESVRSGAFAAYASAQRYLADADVLKPIFDGLTSLEVPRKSSDLSAPCANQNCVRAALEVLRSDRPDNVEPLRYALAFADSNANRKAFDSHDVSVQSPEANARAQEEHARTQHYALWQIFEVLREAHRDGVWNPDETLVFINTEFGRRQKKAETNGTEHHPQGYVNMLIGGPLARDGHVGAIDVWSASGLADGEYTTTDVRAAVALAAGIDPYQGSMFGEGADFAGARLAGEDRATRYDTLIAEILGADESA